MKGPFLAWVFLAAAALASPSAVALAEADPEALVGDVLPLKDQLALAPQKHGQEADGGAGENAATPAALGVASIVIAPARAASQGILDLGLYILNTLLAGVQHGAAAYVGAAHAVVAHPVESAGIAMAAIALVGLASALAAALQRYGSLGAIPLFSRIAKSQLLDNPVRSQIFDLIRANPGVNVSEISRRLDIAWGTTTHHLQKLRQDRMVAIRVVANQKCYFPNGGTFTAREMDIISATRNPTARRIADYLVRGGPRSHGDIARDLGVTPALVTFHVGKLVRGGVVSRAREGRRTIFTPLETNLDPQPRPASHL